MQATFLQLLIIIVIIIINLGNQQKTSIVSILHFFPLQICRLSDEDILLWFNPQWFTQAMQGTASDGDTAAAVHEQLYVVARSRETVTLVSSLTCCQMG